MTIVFGEVIGEVRAGPEPREEEPAPGPAGDERGAGVHDAAEIERALAIRAERRARLLAD